MNDPNDPKHASASPPLSSSGLPASDRSLERVLGAIDRTIRSFESVLHMIHTEVTAQGALNLQRHEMAIKMLGKMRVELATLSDQLRSLIQSHGIQLDATNEARNALERTRQKLEEAVEDISGEHAIIDPGDDEEGAPRNVKLIAARMGVWLANFAWPVAVRGGKQAMWWAAKLLAGSTVLGALGKVIHDLISGS